MKNPVVLILIFLAILLIAYNATMLNFEQLFEGDSLIALIGILASLCAIVLLLIYAISKKIQNKVDKK